MLALLGVAATLSALVPASIALKVDNAERNSTPGAHVRSLAAEAFDLRTPGERTLLRMPREPAAEALIRVTGHFLTNSYAPCVTYLSNLTIRGEWLGGRILHVGLVNGSLSVKVSSTSPSYAGPWRSVESLEGDLGGGLEEEFPGTVRVSTFLPRALRRSHTVAEAPSFHVEFGPQEAKRRSLFSVSQGLREGLDVSLSNMRVANWSLQPTYLQNLADEVFIMNVQGGFDLLRVPKLKVHPPLIRARGAFVSADNASCVVYLSNVTISGKWLGGKVVHLRSWNGSFAMKISSEMPPAAGTWRAVDAFLPAVSGPEAFPETFTVRAVANGPAFEFRLGPNETELRPSITVTQALHGGLDISLADMNHMDVPEVSGLLGTERHDGAFDVHSADCEAELRRFREPPASSSLTASWGP